MATPDQIRILEEIKERLGVNANLAKSLPRSHPTYELLTPEDREVLVHITVDEAIQNYLGSIGSNELYGFTLVIEGEQIDLSDPNYLGHRVPQPVEDPSMRKRDRKALEKQLKWNVVRTLNRYCDDQGISVDDNRIQDIADQIAREFSRLLLDARITEDNFQSISCRVRDRNPL